MLSNIGGKPNLKTVVVLMLAHRRRWLNIDSVLFYHVVLTGKPSTSISGGGGSCVDKLRTVYYNTNIQIISF